jgi:hypothetical protein
MVSVKTQADLAASFERYLQHTCRRPRHRDRVLHYEFKVGKIAAGVRQ